MNRRNALRKSLTLALVAAFGIGGSLYVAGFAATSKAPAAALSEDALVKNIALLETRFFSRQYPNDPTEKRLERLELLVFGSTQDGTNDQRYARIKAAIADRSQSAAGKATSKAPSKDTEKELKSSTQYPVLNTLEWRALQKTYPSETLDQRLGRLEKKLFGAENPSMAYADRVDRLKRTLGIGVTAMKSTGPLGPAPKARPRSQMGDGFFGYSAPPVFDDNGDQDGSIGQMPMFDGTGLTGTFSQMFRDLNRQMAQMNRLGPGNWVYDSNSGVWTEKNSGRTIKPLKPGQPFSIPETNSLAPKPKQKLLIPGPSQQHISPIPLFRGTNPDNGGLPPYADPNSI